MEDYMAILINSPKIFGMVEISFIDAKLIDMIS